MRLGLWSRHDEATLATDLRLNSVGWGGKKDESPGIDDQLECQATQTSKMLVLPSKLHCLNTFTPPETETEQIHIFLS